MSHTCLNQQLRIDNLQVNSSNYWINTGPTIIYTLLKFKRSLPILTNVNLIPINDQCISNTNPNQSLLNFKSRCIVQLLQVKAILACKKNFKMSWKSLYTVLNFLYESRENWVNLRIWICEKISKIKLELFQISIAFTFEKWLFCGLKVDLDTNDESVDTKY